MTRRRFAETTNVSADQSLVEIKTTLKRYGAVGFAYDEEDRQARVAFEIAGRRILLRLPLPAESDDALTDTGRVRSDGSRQDAHGQEVRHRWRVLLLLVKARLEAIDLGLLDVDQAFLADLLLPDGHTLGDTLQPQLQTALAGTAAPRLPPAPNH